MLAISTSQKHNIFAMTVESFQIFHIPRIVLRNLATTGELVTMHQKNVKQRRKTVFPDCYAGYQQHQTYMDMDSVTMCVNFRERFSPERR